MRRQVSIDDVNAHAGDLTPMHVSYLRKAAAGATYKEMAKHFNVPVGTIRSGLHRARSALENLVQEQKQEAQKP